jgi:predicted MFS family arabinose efflux permease
MTAITFVGVGLMNSSAIVGAILQTAAINLEMLFVGRVIGGIASGLIFGVVS